MIGNRLVPVMLLSAMATLTLLPHTASAVNPKLGAEKYALHEFDEAIVACDGGKDFASRLILGLAYTEKYNIYKR